MMTDAETDGPQLSFPGDPRVIPVGRFMRKYHIDEIPNLWNVLIGDMSIVGPRPERAYFIEKIIARAPEYAKLHRIKPGLTSWGMVRHGYAYDVEGMISRMKYDMVYLEEMSYAQAARVMKKSQKQIDNLLYRAKKELRRILGEDKELFE